MKHCCPTQKRCMCALVCVVSACSSAKMHAAAIVSIGHAFLNYILINIKQGLAYVCDWLACRCLSAMQISNLIVDDSRIAGVDHVYVLPSDNIQPSVSCCWLDGWWHAYACRVGRCVRACVRTKDTITTAHTIRNWCRQMPSCICTKNNQTTCSQRDVCGDVPPRPTVVRDDVTSGICVTII
jgi:hypothetical protein